MSVYRVIDVVGTSTTS
jgi:flavin-binding protein dodecin